MVLTTITFDATSAHWTNSRDCNFAFLRVSEKYMDDLIRHRGYVYLNEVYEQLGIKWNPEDVNPYIKNDGVSRLAFIQFEVFAMPDNAFLVHIMSYD